MPLIRRLASEDTHATYSTINVSMVDTILKVKAEVETDILKVYLY